MWGSVLCSPGLSQNHSTLPTLASQELGVGLRHHVWLRKLILIKIQAKVSPFHCPLLNVDVLYAIFTSQKKIVLE